MQDQFHQIIERLKAIEQRLQDASIGNNEFLSHEQAALYLHIKPQTLYHLVSQGKITPTKPNGKLNVYRRSDLDNFLRNNKIK